MVPMHGRTAEGAFHEPPVWSPGFSRSGPPEGGTPYRWHDPGGFMAQMHGTKAVETLRMTNDEIRKNTEIQMTNRVVHLRGRWA